MYQNPNTALQGVKSMLSDTLQGGVFHETLKYSARPYGKMVRAQLGIALSRNERGWIPKEIVPRLAAIELLHLATLIHDDLIDHSDTRRGKKTLYRKFGENKALLTGDYLYIKCFSLIKDDKELTEQFYKTISRLCCGEMREINNQHKPVSVPEYARTVNQKTASLFALCGAAAMQDYTENERLCKLCRGIGVWFQLRDDIKDCTVSGEKRYTDFKNGVMTIPHICTLELYPWLKEDKSRDVLRYMDGGVAIARQITDKYESKLHRRIKKLPRQNAEAVDELLTHIKSSL